MLHWCEVSEPTRSEYPLSLSCDGVTHSRIGCQQRKISAPLVSGSLRLVYLHHMTWFRLNGRTQQLCANSRLESKSFSRKAHVTGNLFLILETIAFALLTSALAKSPGINWLRGNMHGKKDCIENGYPHVKRRRHFPGKKHSCSKFRFFTRITLQHVMTGLKKIHFL